uniref:Uncharacterized protein n=1 Tax=Megaselia scalaris TaxID=36166 RepID=T1GS10_MEGSC
MVTKFQATSFLKKCRLARPYNSSTYLHPHHHIRLYTLDYSIALCYCNCSYILVYKFSGSGSSSNSIPTFDNYTGICLDT